MVLQRAALVTTCLLAIQGCATLPDAGRALAKPHPRQVQMEGARGRVPAARSEAILGRIEGTDGASEVLEKHLAYEQTVNAGSPLVLGNKLTLLKDGPATYQAMIAAIREARDHINLETYIFADDEIGR